MAAEALLDGEAEALTRKAGNRGGRAIRQQP
jgi:hypothetical protein